MPPAATHSETQDNLTVRLSPSGQEYRIDGKESLLEAALRAGLHLDFGCSNGNCGKCKCRVVSGCVSQLQPNDYIFSQQEKESGYALACSVTATSNLVIEVHEANNPAELPRQKIRATVKAIKQLGEDGALLQLKTPRSQVLRFMSGQSVRLTTDDGQSALYPLASCACDGRNLEFLIRKQTDGFESSVFSDSLQGKTLTIEGPVGNFVLHEETRTPIIFIGAEDGTGPIVSMVEQAISIDTSERLHLYLLDTPAWGTLFDNRFRAWQDAIDNFHLKRRPQDTSPESLLREVSADSPDLADCIIYIAGPAEFVTALQNQLQACSIRHANTLVTDAKCQEE